MQSNEILKLQSKALDAPVSNVKPNSSVINHQTTSSYGTNNTNGDPFSVTGVQQQSPSNTQQNMVSPNNMQDSSGGIITLSLTKNRKGKDFSDYIPAGTYVTAKIISGANTTVGINSTSDPKPVLLRLQGKAKTANTITGEI